MTMRKRAVLLMIFLTKLLMVSADPAEGQTLSDYIWERTVEHQQQALNSNMIFGVSEGCLSPADFGSYMIDDSVYSYEIAKSLEIAIKRCDKDPTLQKFLRDEAELWDSSWRWLHDVWHIKHPHGINLGQEAANYMNHLRQVAETEDPAYLVIALTPGVKLWSWIGKQIGSKKRDFGVYTEWVEQTLDPDCKDSLKYDEYTEWAYQAGEVTAEKALEVFSASMKSEVDFFNSVTRCQPRVQRDGSDKC
ncbi:hypothetical protein ACHWQZ_G010180 [Mnemiopsis leidyi]